MKIICAWCQSLIGYKCPYCGGPLEDPPLEHYVGRYKVCTQCPVQTYIAIETMAATHGICNYCRDREALARNHPDTERQNRYGLSDEDRAHIAALDGAGNRGNHPTRRKTQ